jgi:hypothetical protein
MLLFLLMTYGISFEIPVARRGKARSREQGARSNNLVDFKIGPL